MRLLHSNHGPNVRGVVLLEFILVIPFLFILVTHTYDIYRLIQTNLILTHIVQGGVRTGENLNGLEKGKATYDGVECKSYYSSAGYSTCSPLSLQKNLLSHIWSNVQSDQTLLSEFTDILITVEKSSSTPPGTISVTITGSYQGLFFPYRNLPMTVTLLGPLL